MWIEQRGLQHRVYWRTGLASPKKASRPTSETSMTTATADSLVAGIPLMFGVGVPELLVICVISLLNIGLGLWALMDAMSRPDAQWIAAGENKGLWLVIHTVILVIGCFSFGWIAAVLYFLIPRPALQRVGRSVGGR